MKKTLLALLIFYGLPALALPQKVIIVIFENTPFEKALRLPFFNQFAKEGALLMNYHAVAHPSQPNYVDIVAGNTMGIKGDGRYNLQGLNLADRLEEEGKTWHVYAEQYPGGCYTGMHRGAYYRKHNPLISFVDIENNPIRCANITDATSFMSDFVTGKLANFVMYIPNIYNDGHATSARFSDLWFSRTFGPLIRNPEAMKDVLIVATFDEDDGLEHNHIYTALYGPDVTPGIQISNQYTHTSLLKTIEDIFGLKSLDRGDLKAPSFVNYLLH